MKRRTFRQIARRAKEAVVLRLPQLGRASADKHELQQPTGPCAEPPKDTSRDAVVGASAKRLDLSEFIRFGSMVFDIGAFEGFKTLEYLKLGASVVCFEPNRESARVLQDKFKDNPHVRIEKCGLSDHEGVLLFYPSTVRAQSTFSQSLKEAPWFSREQWSPAPYEVEITTIEKMVENYGLPGLVKIDVEGVEASVVRGMGCARPRYLSFEFYPGFPAAYRECIDILGAFGYAKYNYIINGIVQNQESDEFRFDSWVDRELLLSALSEEPRRPGMDWGDVYATLV